MQNCIDTDECAINAGGCTGDSFCLNSKGSFSCECNVDGYGYTDGVCSDIDECSTGRVRPSNILRYEISVFI